MQHRRRDVLSSSFRFVSRHVRRRRRRLRAHVQRHQLGERLRLAQARELGGVRSLRLTNRHRAPEKRGDLRVVSSARAPSVFAAFAGPRAPSIRASRRLASLRKPRAISRARPSLRVRARARASPRAPRDARRRRARARRATRRDLGAFAPSRRARFARRTHQTQQKHRRPVPPLALARRRLDGVHDAVDHEHDERPRRHEPHVPVAPDERALLELFLRHHGRRRRLARASTAVDLSARRARGGATDRSIARASIARASIARSRSIDLDRSLEIDRDRSVDRGRGRSRSRSRSVGSRSYIKKTRSEVIKKTKPAIG